MSFATIFYVIYLGILKTKQQKKSPARVNAGDMLHRRVELRTP